MCASTTAAGTQRLQHRAGDGSSGRSMPITRTHEVTAAPSDRSPGGSRSEAWLDRMSAECVGPAMEPLGPTTPNANGRSSTSPSVTAKSSRRTNQGRPSKRPVTRSTADPEGAALSDASVGRDSLRGSGGGSAMAARSPARVCGSLSSGGAGDGPAQARDTRTLARSSDATSDPKAVRAVPERGNVGQAKRLVASRARRSTWPCPVG